MPGKPSARACIYIFLTGHLAMVPLLKRAIEIDPNFATAYAWQGRAYGAIGESDLARETTRTAWRLRSRATDQERFYIDFSYYRLVTGDIEKSCRDLPVVGTNVSSRPCAPWVPGL